MLQFLPLFASIRAKTYPLNHPEAAMNYSKIVPTLINVPTKISNSFLERTHAKPPPLLKSFFPIVPVRLFGSG